MLTSRTEKGEAFSHRRFKDRRNAFFWEEPDREVERKALPCPPRLCPSPSKAPQSSPRFVDHRRDTGDHRAQATSTYTPAYLLLSEFPSSLTRHLTRSCETQEQTTGYEGSLSNPACSPNLKHAFTLGNVTDPVHSLAVPRGADGPLSPGTVLPYLQPPHTRAPSRPPHPAALSTPRNQQPVACGHAQPAVGARTDGGAAGPRARH